MAKTKVEKIETTENITVSPNDPGWTDYVLSLLTEDEKIMGNPTTDGLRRIFEIALDCKIIASTTDVIQSPEPSNEKRATVCHSITYCLKNMTEGNEHLNTVVVDGAADVYWGNCDKIFRNHPVAVAETRAEGRALRRGLKLRKVIAAEEMTQSMEDDPDGSNVNKIVTNQISFIDTISQRLNINPIKLLKHLNIDHKTIYDVSHDSAVEIVRQLSTYKQNIDNIPEAIIGYDPQWR